MKHKVLFLGSQSQSRQLLLKEAGIPFRVLAHRSSEQESVFNKNMASYVISIAKHKMDSLDLHSSAMGDLKKILVLTADSLVQDVSTQRILGKPKDVDDARAMLALARNSEMLILTACCLREYIWDTNNWSCSREQVWTTETFIEFIVPVHEVDYYLMKVPEAMYSAGAGILENFGGNYLKSIRGSFTGGRGLPLYELRNYLDLFDFEFE